MYAARDFNRLFGIKGFSSEALENHFALYRGYVQATNEVLEALGELRTVGTGDTRAAAELRRRLGWEFNGMRLHELYFEQLGGNGKLDPEGRMGRGLVATFGSLRAWEKDLRATGSMRGIGWAVLHADPASGLFFNAWLNEHDVGNPVGCAPLVVLDVFEHAYMLEYGIDRDGYFDAFLANLDWNTIAARLPPA